MKYSKIEFEKSNKTKKYNIILYLLFSNIEFNLKEI